MNGSEQGRQKTKHLIAMSVDRSTLSGTDLSKNIRIARAVGKAKI